MSGITCTFSDSEDELDSSPDPGPSTALSATAHSQKSPSYKWQRQLVLGMSLSKLHLCNMKGNYNLRHVVLIHNTVTRIQEGINQEFMCRTTTSHHSDDGLVATEEGAAPSSPTIHLDTEAEVDVSSCARASPLLSFASHLDCSSCLGSCSCDDKENSEEFLCDTVSESSIKDASRFQT